MQPINRKPVLPATKLPSVTKGTPPRMPAPGARAPGQKTPVQKAPSQRAPVQKAPIRRASAQATPAQATPAQATSARQKIDAMAAPHVPDAPLPSMGNRFVAVKLSVAIPSNVRQSRKIVERNAQHGGASTKAAKASVVLFDPAKLDTLRNVRANATAELNDMGLKMSDGHYIIHASQSRRLIEMGVTAEQAYREAAAEFVAGYQDYCDEWMGYLGDDYDESLYPNIERIAQQVGVNIGQTRNTHKNKRGFVFSMSMINEHDEGLEDKLGLSLSDSEREFISSGVRAHYQSVSDQAFDQLRDAMTKIVEGDKPGKRVRKALIDNAHAIAEKIERMGLDQDGVAARAREVTATHAPERKGRVDRKGSLVDNSAREAYIARTQSVLDDLASLQNGTE